MPLDVILNFEDREKWAIPFTEIGEQWASSSRYGFGEGLYQPTKNNGVILIFTDTDEEGRMGCRIEIIPKLTQLLWNAKIQQKQNRNRPKTEEEKELFSLMFTLYADKLFWSNHPEHIDLMIDEEEDDLLDTEPIYGGGTLRPRGSIRKQIAHIIDKAFQEKNLDIIKKIAPFYESILELVVSDFYLHYLTSRPDDRDIRVLHSLVPNTSKQFLRLTTIIKEHLNIILNYLLRTISLKLGEKNILVIKEKRVGIRAGQMTIKIPRFLRKMMEQLFLNYMMS